MNLLGLLRLTCTQTVWKAAKHLCRILRLRLLRPEPQQRSSKERFRLDSESYEYSCMQNGSVQLLNCLILFTRPVVGLGSNANDRQSWEYLNTSRPRSN